MRAMRLLFALGIAVLLAGCVPSLQPLYTGNDLVSDNTLLGTWVGEGESEGETWVFKQAKNKVYDLTITCDGEPAEFEACLVRLGGATFMDTYPINLGKKLKNDYLQTHVIPSHNFARVKVREDVLLVEMLNPAWLEELLDKDDDAIAHDSVDDETVLTASTADLQKFFRKYADSDDPFEPVKFHRKK